MIIGRVVFCTLLILASGLFERTVRADDEGEIKVITDWTEDDQPIRVDCSNLPIVGGGFGGAQLSCADRLTLYATLSCFPMKKEDVKEMCPEWEGLKADIDWGRVAELVDARADEEKKKKHEFEQRMRERQEAAKIRDSESRD